MGLEGFEFIIHYKQTTTPSQEKKLLFIFPNKGFFKQNNPFTYGQSLYSFWHWPSGNKRLLIIKRFGPNQSVYKRNLHLLSL